MMNPAPVVASAPSLTKLNKTDRAGTLFSVGRILRRLRNEGLKPRVRSQAAVAVAAFLDDLFGAVMQDSVFTTLENKRTRIRPRYVARAIALDSTLKVLMKGAIPGAGVQPNIHSVLLPQSRRKAAAQGGEAGGVVPMVTSKKATSKRGGVRKAKRPKITAPAAPAASSVSVAL